MADPHTTTGRFMTRIKNNPVLGIVIIRGVLVIFTVSSLNAVDDIRDFFLTHKHQPKPRLRKANPNPPPRSEKKPPRSPNPPNGCWRLETMSLSLTVITGSLTCKDTTPHGLLTAA